MSSPRQQPRQLAEHRVTLTTNDQFFVVIESAARGFDGYKGHLALDPDTEILTATEVTAANTGDADPAEDLLAQDLPKPAAEGGDDTDADCPWP
jgi:hypothetical protein